MVERRRAGCLILVSCVPPLVTSKIGCRADYWHKGEPTDWEKG
jgi:hypothetical protein